ncbi:hypothetical protein [Ferrovibrio sp.]|uniref:hypothetical protein n=1 Tax=Ferrovibrio sp. TaxID=1917215 RepID=UPI003D0B34E8
MLAELLLSTMVRCEPAARQLGYGRAQVGLWSRSRRCAKAWAPHHAESRAFVESLLSDLPQGGTAWVLGAGLLDDLPLQALSAKFDRVLLADIAWLPMQLWRLKRFPNLEARQFDVSGLVPAMLEWRPGKPLPEPQPEALLALDAARPNLVLSLNLLSQLPLLPLEKLERAGQSFVMRQAYGRRIVAAHLAGLRLLDCRVGLVSEQRRIFRNRAGEVVMSESALFDVTPPVAEKEWGWNLAPLGEIDNQTALELRVFASRDLGRDLSITP